ncbi:MAG: hypothetical protein JHC84_14785 [Solirubrobacteraceae bacterium]|nr:hypothetical protein [Solirubrobacteraceae bacterium]
MKTLLRRSERPASTEEPAAEPAANGNPPVEPSPPEVTPSAEAPAATCQSCGAAMAADQDWCLECGTAAPGRLGERPGWRLGAMVLVLTLLLVGGASVAGYAAVTGDAERETAAQNPAPGTPVPSQVPQPPAPERPTSEPPEPEPVESVEPAPSADVQPDVSTPDTSVPDNTVIDPVTPLPDTSTDTTTDDTVGGTNAEEFTAFDVKADELEVFDPYERAGAEFGDPEDALNTTDPFFDVTVPADGEAIGAGLKIDLGAVRTVREITFRTTTPGMGLQVYGVKSGDPSGLKAGWRLVSEPDLPSGERDVTITLDAGGEELRRIVLWFTTAANAEDPRASVGRLKVLG